ncbi:MAG: hypothetical protein PHW24_02535 [Candidatus Moranbacteria bacterium]|nr:hypothetical protein [Candidatus Moranbacteria bacterium]
MTGLKFSSLLEKAALKAAADMLEKGLSEIDIPEMSSFHISKTEIPPSGYLSIRSFEQGGAKLFLFQKM